MNWKQFFKPTIGKIILFIIILLVLPIFGWQNFICKPCLSTTDCPPCGGYQFKFFGIPLLIMDFISPGLLSYPKFITSNLSINIILIIIMSYILSSLIIHSFKIIYK